MNVRHSAAALAATAMIAAAAPATAANLPPSTSPPPSPSPLVAIPAGVHGGTDLVAALNATDPAPATTQTSDNPSEKEKDSDDGYGTWWTVGVFLVAGIGIGFLISGRRKQP
ncbi:hypothetical protein [Streptomyces sp. NPDC088812]|uniref:hypothetical protein n=1 Tax=Streptomyces sp. NPDC088812 TaxID=3365905 RepID=UPI00380404E8